jgi:hypothetical protein
VTLVLFVLHCTSLHISDISVPMGHLVTKCMTTSKGLRPRNRKIDKSQHSIYTTTIVSPNHAISSMQERCHSVRGYAYRNSRSTLAGPRLADWGSRALPLPICQTISSTIFLFMDQFRLRNAQNSTCVEIFLLCRFQIMKFSSSSSSSSFL